MAIFGKIDYINLLPLHVFLKSSSMPNSIKSSINYKKGVPSKINKELTFNRINCAVISSIQSFKPKYQTLNMGICAYKKVRSVLVKKNDNNLILDPASATSNALAKLLNTKGEVIIGDKALKAWLDNNDNNLAKNSDIFIDLCSLWYDRTHLPFVFARFSFIKKNIFFNNLIKNFIKKKLFIPNYILKEYANSRHINPQKLKEYLTLIYYEISHKEKLALKKFKKNLKNI